MIKANPIPLPFPLEYLSVSSWLNLSNINFCFSLGIPIPVSFTLILKYLELYVSVTKIFPLAGVNFKALERRFKMTL